MEDSFQIITQLAATGVNGFLAALTINLIQQNRRLIAEIIRRDDKLMQLIDRLINLLDSN